MRTSLLVCLSVIFLVGCSTNQPKGFVLQNTLVSEVWPLGSDLPRYRYIGELHGEHVKDALSSESIFDMIVGLITGKPEPIRLKRPYDIYVSSDNLVYVADLALPGVLVFNLNDNTMSQWGGIESSSPFVAPVGLTGVGNEIFVVDTNLAKVLRFSKQGELLGSFGSGELKRPIGIAFDPVNNYVFISDAGAHNIRVYTREGSLIRTIGGQGDAKGLFNHPSAIEFTDNKLYVSDTMNARIQILEPDNINAPIHTLGYRGLNIGNTPRPKGVSSDSDGNVYAVESYFGYLLVYNDKGEFLLPISGKGRDIGEFYLPSGVTVDDKDRVYLADMFNGRIVMFQYLGK